MIVCFILAAVDLYENLLKKSSKSTSEKDWVELWVKPVLEIVSEESVSAMRVLKTALKFDSTRLIQALVQQFDETKPNLALICLKLDRANGGKNYIKYLNSVVYPCLNHFEDSTRILALDLIVSSHSSREDFDSTELELIMNSGLPLNMVLQQSQDRQNMITVLKKMILRLKSAMTSSSRHKDAAAMENFYEEFVRSLFTHFGDSIFDGASFSRRSIALECLNELGKTFFGEIHCLPQMIYLFFSDSFQ